MAMYALAMVPLIHCLKSNSPDVKQAWYANDAKGAGSCEKLRHDGVRLCISALPMVTIQIAENLPRCIEEEHESKAKNSLPTLMFTLPSKLTGHNWCKVFHRRVSLQKNR